MPPRLVIFDCDGVLVDTEKIYFDINRAFVLKYRSRGDSAPVFNLEYYEHFIGSHARTMWSELKENFGLPGSVESLIEDEKERKKIALSRAELKPMSGVVELLANLKALGVLSAVASSGRRDNVHLILEKIGLKNEFAAIVAGEDVKNGKPAPDIFLKACSLCSETPEVSVVIEDSQNGARAAKAAGMGLVGYVNPHSGRQDLSLADIKIKSFADPALKTYLKI